MLLPKFLLKMNCLFFLKNLFNFRTLVIISPFFLLSIKHWINTLVILIFFGSLYYLFKNKINFKFSLINILNIRIIFCISLIGPFFSVLLAQFLRNDLYLPNLDSPLRLALCIPIFLAISNGWLTNKYSITYMWSKYIFPFSILITFVSILLKYDIVTVTSSSRISTYFVDPISFGSLVLLMSFNSIIHYSLFHHKYNYIYKIFILTAIFIGFYLSILSGSRAGLLVIPFFILFWSYTIGIKYIGIRKTLFYIFLSLTIIIFFIYSDKIILKRIYLAIIELCNYKFDEINPDNSVGMRISFYRNAIFYFFERPLTGWGDLGWLVLINSPETSNYSSLVAREFAKNGFHNEILTNSVRSGIWGFISTISLFFIPLYASLKIKNNELDLHYKLMKSLIVLFILHNFIVGITTEVTNLVFLSSFFGLTLSVYLGEMIYFYSNKNTTQRNL